MLQRFVMAVLVIGVPGVSWAQAVPERVLPPGSQIYLRWDGFDAHREDFNKSAVGKMMQGDTGKFLSGLVDFLGKQVDNLAGRADPQMVEIIKDVPHFFRVVGKHGFRIGVQVRKLMPPEIEGVLVFPKAAKGDDSILPLLKKVAGTTGTEVKETKVGKRTVFHVAADPVHLGWWQEGDDAVVAIGTLEPEKVAKRISGKGRHFTDNHLYKELQEFKEFSAWADGFLDLAGLAKVAKGLSPDVGRLIDDLGLNGLKSITLHSGFDGPAERSVVFIDIPGPRKGLLRIANQKKLSLTDLPPMPTDLTSFTASNLDLAGLYDAVVEGVEVGVRIFAPGEAGKVKDGIQFVENILGVKLREELFGSMGDLIVQYSSPAEGPLGLGAVYLVKVKNAEKLQAAIESLLKTLSAQPFIQVDVRKRTYHEVDLNEIHINQMGNFYLPTYAIHKGWLAFSLYPQPIKGFVLRTNNKLPAWKANAKLSKRLAELPKEFVAISVSDPRPGLRFLLSIAPTAVTVINGFTTQFAPGLQFDAGLIPNAHEATRHLFPNITVCTDDGKKVRIETRASLALPF